jgi:hypothetical protein
MILVEEQTRIESSGPSRNTHMECGLSAAQGFVARGVRGEFGGESAPAVVADEPGRAVEIHFAAPSSGYG